MLNHDTIFLDARLLQIFCVAAEELHFGRAAERMCMSQPPFSQQIKRLEKLVEAQLFVRTTRSVRLTPAGEVMLSRAKRLASDTGLMLRAVRQAARGEAGSLSIGLTISANCSPLAEALYQYRITHPHIELDLREMNSSTMESALRLRQIDVALMRPVHVDADISTTEVYREPMVLAVRRDHPWAGQKCVSLEQVAEVPLIGYEQAISPYFRRMVHQMFAQTARPPRIVQESAVPTNLTLVEAGVGVAIVPLTILRARSDTLTYVPLHDRSMTQAVTVMAMLRSHPNPAANDLAATMLNVQADLAGRSAKKQVRRKNRGS
ncbi:LysR substrate-binding domain-containing protein [Ramlibacter tataouinensis]|uniref:LysR family transcriptional regulator n=1 Tax=Ramlibacter tataouinensis TaxID=94132 RepID=UPI0022F3F851|nr:LysR substrate-binding domain-containing protein [Ramlibacter tataouinensis]WBY01245.1 LysR substrate-binding domain-containing protein [Ramlibacter tataouinensis]